MKSCPNTDKQSEVDIGGMLIFGDFSKGNQVVFSSF